MPRVTAVITTFNRAEFLRPAVQSVLGQTFRDLELLVLDNSSTDSTQAVVQQFDDPRMRYIRHAPLTIGGARNEALRHATGEFVAYLDDDDEWLPDKTRKQVDAFAHMPEEVALVYGGFVRFDGHGREFATHLPVLRGKVLTGLLWQDPFTGSASNPMIRASVLHVLGGYNPSIATSEDWELYLRLAERYDVENIPDVVVRIRKHSGPRLGDRLPDAGHVEEMVLARYRSVMSPKLQSFYLQKIGGKLCRIGASSQGRARIMEAIRIHPLNLLACGQLAVSFLGPAPYRWMHACYKRLF